MKLFKRKCSAGSLVQIFWIILATACIIYFYFIKQMHGLARNELAIGKGIHAGSVNNMQESDGSKTNVFRYVSNASQSHFSLPVATQSNKTNEMDKITRTQENIAYEEPITIEGHLAVQLLEKWKQLQGNFKLRDDDHAYMIQNGKLLCLKEGTDLVKTFNESNSVKCVCLANWYGEHCSIPFMVHALNRNKKFTLRTKPRRIIESFFYHREWETLSQRLHDTGDLVDAFIIQDSVFTGYGDPKNTSLIQSLLNSSLPNSVKGKILPKVMLTFPQGNFFLSDILTYLMTLH